MTFVSAPEQASAIDKAGLFFGDNMYLIAGAIVVAILLVVLLGGGTKPSASGK